MQAFNHIKAFIFDVDGVLTDGYVQVLANGEQVRSFNIKDGWAINHALKQGYMLAIISSGNHEGVRKRLEYLNIPEIHLAVKDKMVVFNSLKEKYGLLDHQILYMGDDIPDLKILQQVGLPCCPADAVVDVLQVARYVSPVAGGKGCDYGGGGFGGVLGGAKSDVGALCVDAGRGADLRVRTGRCRRSGRAPKHPAENDQAPSRVIHLDLPDDRYR